MSTLFDLQLDLEGPLPAGRAVIEASAGTGKTYALSALTVRYIAEMGDTAADLLMVTFTRAAAAELRDRTRTALQSAHTVLHDRVVPEQHAWMRVLLLGGEEEVAERAKRVQAALNSFDDATITTIHGYCQQALRQLGLRAGTRLGSELVQDASALIAEVCHDVVVSSLLHDPLALSWPKNDGDPVMPKRVLERLIEVVTKLLANPGAVVLPDDDAVAGSPDTQMRLARWREAVEHAHAEVLRRREERHQLAFDDLVSGLHAAVTDERSGPAAVEALRARYRRVLVDEFQDTDPVQWDVFRHVFADRLLIVGDPKQAIYRFRGADVHAYLAATEGTEPKQLATNRRSDADLVRATNTLVTGVRLGHPRIIGTEVHAAPDAQARRLHGVPLEVRHLHAHDNLRTRTGQLSVPLMRHAVLADLVHVVADLLDSGQQLDPGDIAVLVPSHATAEMVYDVLSRARIPAVRTRTGSVLETSALGEWQRLLAALERPAHQATVRAAALGAFLRTPIEMLDPEAEGSSEVLNELQRRCRDWAEMMGSRPLMAWYDEVRASSGLVPRVLAQPRGERELTDLDHVAELLATELGGRGHSVSSVRRRLDALASSALDEVDPQMRRIDSDARAVQITTLHASKGLEYPVVLLPFSWCAPPNVSTLVYQADAGRVIDVASGQGWSGPPQVVDDPDATDEVRRHYATSEALGDQLRLLYVGLTRARHRTVVWWAGPSTSAKTALALVLFDRDDQGAPLNQEAHIYRSVKGKVKCEQPKVIIDDDSVEEALDVLVRRSGHTVGTFDCPPDAPLLTWRGALADADVEPLAIASSNGRVLADPAWRRWSFTGLTRTLVDDWTMPLVAGGTDEPDDAELPPDEPVAAVAVEMALGSVVGGAAFGTFTHAVLEHVDPTSADLEAALAEAVRRQVQRDRMDVDEAMLVAGLSAAIRTPLGPIADGLRLADIAPADRLTELNFDLPLAGTTGRFAAQQIGAVLLDTLPAGDVLRPYAASLAAGRFRATLAGYLQGSIDAVLRVPNGDGGHRHVVVDYKTNRLHQFGDLDRLAAYRPDRLVEAMTHSDYPLQALLYTVALHRYLRWRLRGYSPEQHLGGIAYLFVRGMVGADTPRHEGAPHGVFAWRPPAAAVLALDDLFAGGR